MGKDRKVEADAIELADMFPMLLAADPSFQPVWDSHRVDGDEPLTYAVLGDLASHLLAKLRDGDRDSLKAILHVVELWLEQGARSVREAATVGFVEDLQNINLHRGTTPADIVPFLGPRGRLAWGDVEAFWRDGELIPDRTTKVRPPQR